MPSLHPDYEYDIFISYRHNDNRSGWVTDFVNALQEELAATIKESLNIYFDKNPHDGLHETHDVDDSLKEKVKSIIFIPIVSRTYCDPKSFAWEKEFLPFLKSAKNDEFGLKVKVANGNVASRVLPVRIHDLDKGDDALFEEVIGGVMRGVDFVYGEIGVNRPLKTSDPKKDNLNNTSYSNQINKLANSIREIVGSMRDPEVINNISLPPHKEKKDENRVLSNKTNAKKIIILALIAILASIGFYLFFPRKSDSHKIQISESLTKSVAIMPFEDLSPANDQEWFSDGLSEEIINSLFNVTGLEIRGRNSSFAFKGKSLTIKQFADTLNVNYVVEGSVRKFGNELRITVQLIKASDDTHLWSQQYDREFKDVFGIQTDIANSVANTLNIYLDEEQREKMMALDTRNPEAYEYFLKGRKIYNDVHANVGRYGLWKANEWFDKTLALDSNMASAWNYKADAYNHFSKGHMEAPPSMEITPSDAGKIHRMCIKKAADLVKHNSVYHAHYKLDYIGIIGTDWTEVKPLTDDMIEHFDPNLFSGIEEFIAVFVYPLHGKETAINILDAEIKNDPLYATNKYFYKWHIHFREKDTLEAQNTMHHILHTYREHMILPFKSVLDQDWVTLDSLLQLDYAYDRSNYENIEWWKITLKDEYNPDTIPNTETLDITSESTRYANYHWQNGNPDMANKIMNQLDGHPQKDYFRLLFTLITRFNYQVPFDFESMPNLANRLKEAGIDPSFYQPMPVFKDEYLKWKMNKKN